MTRLGEHIRHPSCITEPYRPGKLILRLLPVILVLVIGSLLWTTWWWVLIAVVLGSALTTHPYCLLTGHKHKPGRYWL